MQASSFDGVAVVAWAAIALGVVLLALAVARLYLPAGRVDPACQKCGYATAGLPREQESCPECGKTLDARDWAYTGEWKSGRLPFSPAAVGAVGWLLVVVGVVQVGKLIGVPGFDFFWPLLVFAGPFVMFQMEPKELERRVRVFNENADA